MGCAAVGGVIYWVLDHFKGKKPPPENLQVTMDDLYVIRKKKDASKPESEKKKDSE